MGSFHSSIYIDSPGKGSGILLSIKKIVPTN